VSFPEHLTLQSVEILNLCNRICSNLPESDLDALPQNLRAKSRSFWELYQEGRDRSENYKDVARAVIDVTEEEAPVAWLTPGHPIIFDSVSQTLLEAGQARGWRVCVVPAISCLDTILADIGYDPAGGLIVYEATSLVAGNLPLLPSLATLLLQPSAFGSHVAHYQSQWAPDLVPLRDYLLQFFAPSHPCAFIRCQSQNMNRNVIWCEIQQINSLSFDAIAGSTLFLPSDPNSGF